MKITSETLQQFKKDLKEAVADLERKYGVIITPENARYTDIEFSLKLAVENDNAKDIKLQHIFTYQPWFKNWYGKEFKDGRHRFTITGYEATRKYPIECERDDGKSYLFSYNYVRDILKQEYGDVIE